MISKLEFPDETIQYFLKLFFGKGIHKEFSHALCLNDGRIYPCGEPCWGDNDSVEPPKSVCEKGTYIGDIHNHREPHYDIKPPFNKGFTNIDFFNLIHDVLIKKINFPYLACVISPVTNDKDDVNGIRIDCEQYDKFNEDDIKNMKTNVKEDDVPEKFSDKEINFIKEFELPKGNFLWYLILANFKNQMKVCGFLKQDSIVIKIKIEKGKIICSKPDKNTINFS